MDQNLHLDVTSRTKAPKVNIVDTLERLQATSHLSEGQWLDLLQVSWKDYYSIRIFKNQLSLNSLEKLSAYFDVPLAQLTQGEIDFNSVSIANSPKDSQIPDYYLIAPHGRLRSTITSIDFLESRYGWRLKSDVLKKFNIFEPNLQDAFAPISIRLITEICDYLHKRQFGPEDFFQMGVHSYQGNKHTLLSKIYTEMPTFKDAFEALFTDVMPLFEQNCHYSFEVMKDGKGLVTAQSNTDVAATLKVKALGSPHICHLKGGIWASTALYFNLNLPIVTHPRCEHRGDKACHYVLDFSTCTPQTQNKLSGALKNSYFCN